MGGVPVFIAVLLGLLLWLPQGGVLTYKYFLLSCLIIFTIGVRDDLIPMKASYKLINQLIPMIITLYFLDVQITSLYMLHAGWEFPIVVTWAISLFTVVVITNSFNLIDGIDGLAGSIGLICLVFFGAWSFLIGEYVLSLICSAFFGGYLAFIIYNWEPSKIIMGDTGALLLGFVVAILSLLFLNLNQDLDAGFEYRIQNPIAILISLLIVPLLDTIRVFVIRISQKKSPFTPDNNHIHYILMRQGMSHSAVVLTLIAINILFLSVAILIGDIGEFYSLVVVLVMAISLNILFYILAIRKPDVKAATSLKPQAQETTIEQ